MAIAAVRRPHGCPVHIVLVNVTAVGFHRGHNVMRLLRHVLDTAIINDEKCQSYPGRLISNWTCVDVARLTRPFPPRLRLTFHSQQSF